jgi:uncharacterized protein (TIGR02597 family)
LQYKSNLLDALWITLTNFVAGASSSTVSDSPGTVGQRFYRLASPYGTSAPAGFLKLTTLGNSDNFVSVPFARAGAMFATVASTSANVISIAGSPWSAGQFVYVSGSQSNTYYARFTSGNAEGRIYRITNNTATAISVDLGTDSSLSGAAPGDTIAIEPYWTFATVFPNGAGVNASPTPGNRNTEVLLPDTASPGINLSAPKVYFFNAGIWKQVGQGSINYGDDVLPPNNYFIIRHNVATNTVVMTMGAVITNRFAISLQTLPASQQDNSVAVARPLPMSLDESGLVSSGSFNASPLPGSRTDELLAFDNTVSSRNKSASAIYYYWNGAWRQVGGGTNNVGTNQAFGGGAAAIIRKGTNGASVVWTNAPNY